MAMWLDEDAEYYETIFMGKEALGRRYLEWVPPRQLCKFCRPPWYPTTRGSRPVSLLNGDQSACANILTEQQWLVQNPQSWESSVLSQAWMWDTHKQRGVEPLLFVCYTLYSMLAVTVRKETELSFVNGLYSPTLLVVHKWWAYT